MTVLSDNASLGSGNSYSWLGDDRGVGSVKPYGEDIVLTAGVAISDTTPIDYNIAAFGRATTIVVSSTLDVACDIDIFIQPVAAVSTALLIYSADDVLAATTGVLIFSPYAGGTGADASLLTVAALASKAYRFILRVAAASNPGGGAFVGYAHCA